MSLMASSASFPNNHNASTSFADPSQSHPSTTAPSITSIPSTASSPSPSSTRETLIPAEPKRTRSFSLLQNISMPFASRPTPLRASMTHADVSSTQMASSEPTNQHDLPQEIVLQIETFLKQLTSLTHPTPLTPEAVSGLFQTFYTRTFNLLPSLLPSPSNSTINLQPLLTATEISDRKRLRGEITVKRAVWEEEIEKRVTTTLYDRIFVLKSADDTERDLKLESKLEALIVVGVQLEHLGVELTEKEKGFLRPAIETIGHELHRLDDVRCPRDKLAILVKVHKILVDGLTFAGEDDDSSTRSSSADLLLPVLIYSIIQAKAETLISNIQFIQRFRADSLLLGEASYCLTNLEAAIVFLETVDLQSLNLATPIQENLPSLQRTSSSSPSLKRRVFSLPLESADPLSALPSEITPPSADSALASLTGSLEASYKLLWSKLPFVDPPRTLDDVRKLISRPFTAGEQDVESLSRKSESPSGKSESPSRPLSKLIVGMGEHKPSVEERGNLITSGFRTLGTSLSRPFSSTKIQPLQTPPQLKSTSREMQDLPVTEGLSGTQSRQMVPLDLPTSAAGSRKIKRVDPRYLEMDAADLRISDVDPLVRELRRVVEALDALHGFEDS